MRYLGWVIWPPILPVMGGHAIDQNGVMTEKQTLHRYLRVQRRALASKLDGVSEYDARRPHTR